MSAERSTELGDRDTLTCIESVPQADTAHSSGLRQIP